MEVKLSKPIIIDGQDVKSIKIDEKDFTLKIMIEIDKPVMEKDPDNKKNIFWRPKSSVEQTRTILKLFTGASERELDQLLWSDLESIMEAVAPFLPSPDETEKSN